MTNPPEAAVSEKPQKLGQSELTSLVMHHLTIIGMNIGATSPDITLPTSFSVTGECDEFLANQNVTLSNAFF